MMVKIAHASIDENGCTRNGQAGDQTGREVRGGPRRLTRVSPAHGSP